MDGLLHTRLRHQLLEGRAMADPLQVLEYMGPVQAQAYAHARTALAMRVHGGTDAQVEEAVRAGRVVRTWLMRGTLHLVAAADLRWIQQLVGPSVISAAMGTFNKGGLTPENLAISMDVLRRELPGNGPMTRSRLSQALSAAGIDMQGPMSSRIFSYAAYEGLICLGPMAGKEDTFVWLDDWVPAAAPRPRAEAVADLTGRYLAGHGPASEADLANWTGLPLRDLRLALQAQQPAVGRQAVAGKELLHVPSPPAAGDRRPLRLLAGFDEYLVGYKDRSWILDAAVQAQAVTSNGIFKPIVLLEGRVAGIWQRQEQKQGSKVLVEWLAGRPDISDADLQLAADDLAAIWGQAVSVTAAP